MNTNSQIIYEELIKTLNIKRLETITAEIIKAYRQKDQSVLYAYSRNLEIDTSEIPLSKCFAKLIQAFHPDKIKILLAQIEEAYQNRDFNKLCFYKNLYLGEVMQAEPPLEYFEDYDFCESDFDNFGISIVEEDTFYEEEENILSKKEERVTQSFYDALNNSVGGTDKYKISIEDMENLTDTLDLSDEMIADLDSIEHCYLLTEINLSKNKIKSIKNLQSLRNLQSLYLSDNQIEDLSIVETLDSLREIDVSFNSIKDPSPLIKCERLEYINLMGNPLEDVTVLLTLERRGVIIIY